MAEFWWAALGFAVAVPAVLVAAAGQRWVVPFMLAWAALPVAVYAGMIGWEMLTRPPVANALGTALYGFMLISPILAVPWVAACLAGFGLGFGIRRLQAFRRGQAAACVPAAPQADPPATDAPHGRPGAAPLETPGWRHVHIGFDGDALRIGSLEVWKHGWRRLGGPPVILPHPTHPQQMHSYSVCAIGPELQPVRFAACELSNGVWGFAIRRDDPVEAQGASQDGSLRYEHCLGELIDGRYDAVSPWAVLTDAASGAVLVDCAAWEFSQVMPNPNGALFLHLRQNAFDVLFRIDPAARTFSNHGERGPDQPLAGLAGAVGEARRNIGRPGPGFGYRHISPNGTVRVDQASVEWSNSHWVNSPRVTDLVRGRVVLDLWGTDWDAAVSFPRMRCVRLDLRRYHHGSSFAAELDMAQDTCRIFTGPNQGDGLEERPLAEVAGALEAYSLRAGAAVARVHGRMPQGRAITPKPWAAWRAALLILAGALAAVAGASFLSLHFAASSAQASKPLAAVPQPDGQAVRPR